MGNEVTCSNTVGSWISEVLSQFETDFDRRLFMSVTTYAELDELTRTGSLLASSTTCRQMVYAKSNHTVLPTAIAEQVR